MPFDQKVSQFSNTFGTYNDIQGSQHVYHGPVYQSHPDRTAQQPSVPLEITRLYLHNFTLPSPPELMIGREQEKATVVDTLLGNSPARVAILGGGGMGKTTLALSVLHEPAIVEQYPPRYFVACEGILSISSLIEAIANALRIPPANRDAFLIDTIFSSFPANTLLCLDNFETPWEDEVMRPDTEEFLSALQPRVRCLIITMRGAQHPSRVSWSKPLLPPLRPLTEDVSRRIFEEMTGNSVDAFVEKLLIAVDGIPLAISLISALLQEEHESSESLWSRWKKSQSSVLESGGKHRLSNLNTSIHLSVNGPQMRADPTTIDILAMFSALPDGFPDDEGAIEELQSHLPERYRVQEALLTMRRVSLVHNDRAAVPRRLRMLSPIQAFCQSTLKGSEELRNGITSYYVKLMGYFKHFENPDVHATIPREMHNARSVLMQAWRRGKGDASLVEASISLTLWSTYLGNPMEEVVRAALEGVVGEPDLQGDCRRALGQVHFRRIELDDAEASFKHAAELHHQIHNVLGEASDLQNLGEVLLGRSNLDDAEAIFKHSLELHRRVNCVVGEGYCHHSLGEVQLRRNNLDEAEAMFKRAIELHRQRHFILGEGNGLQRLGQVHLQRGNLGDAETSFKLAVDLQRKVHNLHGEGIVLHGLGEVYWDRGNLDDAEATFERAAELHRQAHTGLDEGNAFQRLGEIHLERGNLDGAQALFNRATELYRQAHSVLGEGSSLFSLGQVHLERNSLDDAEALFKRAAELHRQIDYVRGEGNDLQGLGRVHLRRNKLDQAEKFLQRAVELHRQGASTVGEENDLRLLRRVHQQRSELFRSS